MEGYSSDGSSSYFTAKMPDELQSAELLEWLAGEENSDLSATGGGLTQSGTEQDQFNQVETSEGSCQTKSGGGRAKLTPAQKRENKRLSDNRYRQKRKEIADEQTAENKRLKLEIAVLKDEYRMLKEKIGLMPFNGQISAEAPQRQDDYIPQSTSRKLDHQSVSLQDPHGTNSGDADKLGNLEINESQNLQEMVPNNAVATNGYITENQKNSQTGTGCDDDTPITDILMKIDADDESKVKFSDFTGLDGERITIGKYSFPLSLRPIVEGLIDVYGDISATSKMNPSIVETTYIMFCASVKEMGDLELEQVTEDKILKWRDTIKDALRINFKVDFAMDHLKKIARAYIGLRERQKLENMAIRISKLEADLNAGKEEHAKIYEQSKVYMDAADEFNDKTLGASMIRRRMTMRSVGRWMRRVMGLAG